MRRPPRHCGRRLLARNQSSRAPGVGRDRILGAFRRVRVAPETLAIPWSWVDIKARFGVAAPPSPFSGPRFGGPRALSFYDSIVRAARGRLVPRSAPLVAPRGVSYSRNIDSLVTLRISTIRLDGIQSQARVGRDRSARESGTPITGRTTFKLRPFDFTASV